MPALSAPRRILVVNAGSSSLKLRLIDDRDELAGSADLEAPDLAPDPGPLAEAPGEVRDAIRSFGAVDAVGHRIVHGGPDLRASNRVDEALVARLDALVELAPLHQPRSIAALRWAAAVLSDVPHVACFDTAFHAGLPAAAATYALPRDWRERWPIRRYGFHGLSHAYVARRGAELVGRPLESLRLISCHLGAGASLAAIDRGRSVDTTMGFTPLDGLVMATRSGSVDPGLVLWLQERGGLSAAAIADGLERHAGLVGLAGTGDMREILAGAAAGEEGALLARDVYLHRLRAGIAAMAAAIGGLDVLAFTGGVGENAAAIRAGAVDGLEFLGAAIDPARNEQGHGDRDIGRGDAAVRTIVVVSREDLEIAREVRAVVGTGT